MRRPTGDQEVAGSTPPSRQHSFVKIDHEIFSTVSVSLSLIQEWQLSVSGERMCTILVNRLEGLACPVNVWLGKLTALDMTTLGWLGRKTSTQTNNTSLLNTSRVVGERFVGLSVESIYQCACPAPQQGHMSVLWLKFPLGLMLTWANRKGSGETKPSCSHIRMYYNGSLPKTRIVWPLKLDIGLFPFCECVLCAQGSFLLDTIYLHSCWC